MGKFCFICGKETEKLIEGYCQKCYDKNISLIKVPDEINVTVCVKCGSIRIKNKWKKADIKNLILEKIKLLVKNIEIEIKEGNIFYEIIATNHKKEMHKIKIKLNKTVCPICARKYTDYYEAVLQIRGKYNDTIVKRIENQLSRLGKRDRKAFYRIMKVKDGFDIRVGSKAAAAHIAESYKKKHNCKIVKSYKLFGKKKGREIYRDFISIRFI